MDGGRRFICFRGATLSSPATSVWSRFVEDPPRAAVPEVHSAASEIDRQYKRAIRTPAAPYLGSPDRERALDPL
jgi:hypothetical protein